MKKLLLITIIAAAFIPLAQCQTRQKLNLDFEQNEKGYPTHWEDFGNKDYKIYADSVNVKTGRFSMVIENNGNVSDYKALSFNLPDNYDGKSIRLTGFIKTENVTGGYAGLWMRIDPDVAFDNMNNRGVSGTTDWKKYEVTLPLTPKRTDKIVIGGLLVGKGKMWLDDLTFTIDGKDINDKKIKIYQKEMLPAAADKEFDSGSKISFPALSDEMIKNEELLGRVWGFLKYHHPSVVKGNYNWDYELFRMLPGFLAAKNNQERDKALLAWIDKYGKIPPCRNCKPTSSDAVFKPGLTWMDSPELSNDLKSKLKEIYNNRNQEENYYISLQPGVANPMFNHENSYINMPYPDDGFRVLSLFRYWNMIEYFFPYKHLTDKKWNEVLKEYIPRFINAKDELQYELASLQLIGEVHDTHANLWGGANKTSELRGTNFAAFRGEFIENKFVVTDYYNPEFSGASKLTIGDIITHINGKTIQSIVDSLQPYYPASNEAARLRDIAVNLLRSSQSSINLQYISNNQSKQEEVPLYEKGKLNMYQWFKVNKDEKCYKFLDSTIGYITLANIKEEDIATIKALFKNTKGIVIDIRNYPSTFVPFALGSYFNSGSAPFAKFAFGNIHNPGEFTFTQPVKIQGDKNYYRGKLVVLVNENSQSQAEYTAMAFRAGNNTSIIGSTTAGADGNVSTIYLPGGLRTMISGIGVYYPNGKETQRIGIVPDITVKPTIEGIKNGKDEVLEKAIEVIGH